MNLVYFFYKGKYNKYNDDTAKSWRSLMYRKLQIGWIYTLQFSKNAYIYVHFVTGKNTHTGFMAPSNNINPEHLVFVYRIP